MWLTVWKSELVRILMVGILGRDGLHVDYLEKLERLLLKHTNVEYYGYDSDHDTCIDLLCCFIQNFQSSLFVVEPFVISIFSLGNYF